jgi:hypothetical protein
MACKEFRVERYFVFIALNLACLIGIGIISWWLTGYWTACVVIIFVDIFLLATLNFFSHYQSNDYRIV